jgi:hypothetical protein
MFTKEMLMKQAKLTFNVSEGKATIVAFENILTLPEIVRAIGPERAERYLSGSSFFLVKAETPNYIRIVTEHNSEKLFVGDKISLRELDEIVSLMKRAGERLSKLIHEEITIII